MNSIVRRAGPPQANTAPVAGRAPHKAKNVGAVFFNEVATRDGFQIEPEFVPTDTKVALIDALSACGYAKIEVTSFTSPRAIPMLRDADEVMGRIQRVPGVEYTVLVPNLRGAERALEARADELNLVMSVSETHNLANLRMPMARSFSALSEVIRRVDGQTPVNVSLSCSFGCPMEGEVAPQAVLDAAARFADQGVRGVTICDTTGMAHPAQVSRLVEALQTRFSALQLTLHFHNTRGMGLANVLAAVQGGITRFDGSLGGLGGCPYAPGASGNISSEDAIHMLDAMGYDTGMDLPRLLALARRLPEIVGHAVPGQVAQAGRITDLHPAPGFVAALREEFR
jgi:hydroxymethylglutaryl-CoA lyase